MRRDVHLFRHSLTSGLQVGKLRHRARKQCMVKGALQQRLGKLFGSVPKRNPSPCEQPQWVWSLESARRAASGDGKGSSQRSQKSQRSWLSPDSSLSRRRTSAAGCSHPSQLPIGTQPRWRGSRAGAHPVPLASSEGLSPAASICSAALAEDPCAGEGGAVVMVRPKSCRIQAAVPGPAYQQAPRSVRSWG